MRIAIVDDSARDRDQLLECLNRYFSDTKGTLETTCFTDAAAFLKDYHYSFDFIILDIDMPGLSGIEAAKVLREKDPHVTLMFVTNMPQYAIEAYSVEAMDYMLKPVSYPDFCLKMKKAERYIRRNADAPVKIQTADGPLMRQASQILYVESRQHYLYYHTEGEVLKVRGKLSAAEESLLPYHFVRAGESYLVNLSRVSGFDGSDVIAGGDRIPVSRRCRTSFLSAYTRYAGGF
jgi:DNA-binding LytR/AlgR family response regulator